MPRCFGIVPDPLDEFCLFFPQHVFPFQQLVVRDPFKSELAFSNSAALAMNVVLWTTITATFGWFTRHRRFRIVIPLACLTLFAVSIATQLSLELVGYRLELDGP